MPEWFRKLSGQKKFLVTWNAILAPFFIAALVGFVMFSGLPFNSALGFAVVFLAAGAGGFLFAWRVAK